MNSHSLIVSFLTTNSPPPSSMVFGPKFNAFIVTVTTSSRRDPLYILDLHGLLLSHEALLISQQPKVIGPDLNAFHSHARPQYRAQGRPPQSSPRYLAPRPWRSRPPTHNYRAPSPRSAPGILPPPPYPPRVPLNPIPQPTSEKPVCQICFRTGHTALVCCFRFTPDAATPQAYVAQ